MDLIAKIQQFVRAEGEEVPEGWYSSATLSEYTQATDKPLSVSRCQKMLLDAHNQDPSRVPRKKFKVLTNGKVRESPQSVSFFYLGDLP